MKRVDMNGGRLAKPWGTLIDRDRGVGFRFNGKEYSGFPGDTIASALAANGVKVLSRSFKYHRPRGIFSGRGWESSTLVQVGDEPNVPAERRGIAEGMEISTQNVIGFSALDLAAPMGLFSKFLPVGFYYKAFYKPPGAWRIWAPLIRHFSGLGRVDPKTDHGQGVQGQGVQGPPEKQYLFCDVAVIGGGPAGLAAALSAAESGARVTLVDDNVRLGGAMNHIRNYARFDANGRRGSEEGLALSRQVMAHPLIRVLTDALCTGWFADHWLSLVRDGRLYKMRAGAVVTATGVQEQPLVFRNNDLPGVMLGSAAQRLLRLHGVRPGRKAVVIAAVSEGYGVALDLLEAGIEVVKVVDPREHPPDCPRRVAVRSAGVAVEDHTTVWEARRGWFRPRVVSARLARVQGPGVCAEPHETVACDLIAVSAGGQPEAGLLLMAGGRFRYDEASATLRITELPTGMFCAGGANGVHANGVHANGAHDLDAVLGDGRRAGLEAARTAGFRIEEIPTVLQDYRQEDSRGENHSYPWPVFPHAKGMEFVDFDEDVQVSDIRQAVLEGYEGMELLKRFTTAGMGPSQGRHSTQAALFLHAQATGTPLAASTPPTSRPPIGGEKFALLAGRSFEPVLKTPMHHRHLEAGARMMPAGQWLRPAYYGPPEAARARIEEEALGVRNQVGLIDVSTLGGLEIRGPDAPEFINRMYNTGHLKQQIGRGRYVLMTDMEGVVSDDGVACRLAEDHYYVTTTTTGSGGVFQGMLFHNAHWRLRVDISQVTHAWCAVNLAGPRSREVLQPLCDDVNLSSENLPYMGAVRGTVAGIRVLIMRVGFVGELGYELHAPWSSGEALWDRLIAAGEPFGIRPFGVEAQRMLRLEKGHIIIGQDTDGLTTPEEADLSWAVSARKPYFIGQRSQAIHAARGISRRLVGFSIEDADMNTKAPVPRECHLVLAGERIAGRVTSCCRSPTLGKVIGLAYVEPNQAAAGSKFEIKVDHGHRIWAQVVELPFYDPEGLRQRL